MIILRNLPHLSKLLNLIARFRKRKMNNNKNSTTMYKIEKLDTTKFTTHKEGDSITLEQVKNIFKQIAGNANLHGHRVGITCDAERRENEHNADFDLVVNCSTKDQANELERILDEMGFDAGGSVGNVHLAKSKKVYIYKKSSKTVE